MEIVDAQVHIGSEGFEQTLAQMDALGISAALLDEFWERTPGRHQKPGYALPNGVWRCVCPTAEQAALHHPDRFSYLLRVHRQDPDLESLIRLTKSAPAARALRVIPMTEGSLEPFSAGAYNELFEMAEDAGLPVFLFTAGRLEAVPQYFKNFPRLSFILDHCAMPWQPVNPAQIDEVLELAAYPNVALKWAHEQELFGIHTYPYEDLLPYLRRAIDAFGAERVMWAGDHSVIKSHSWGNLLFYLRDTPKLSMTEKEWIFSRTLRRIINWPSA